MLDELPPDAPEVTSGFDPDWDPATDDAPGDPAIVDQPAFSHRGLGQVDPFAVPRPWHAIVWPWGLSGLAETLEVVALALIMFVGVRFVAHNYVVDGASMLPTFENGEFVIVNRLAYRDFDLTWVPVVGGTFSFGDPKPGDIVVFAYQTEPRERDFIKRVIAVPGQVVEVRDGVLFVDHQPLDEPYIQASPNYVYPLTAVPPGKLFVLGDNRNNSFDSHLFGLIDQEVVVGRADIRYWPFGRFWMVEHGLGAVASSVARVLPEKGTVAVWR